MCLDSCFYIDVLLSLYFFNCFFFIFLSLAHKNKFSTTSVKKEIGVIPKEMRFIGISVHRIICFRSFSILIIQLDAILSGFIYIFGLSGRK